MVEFFTSILFTSLILLGIFLLLFVIYSNLEKEKRACKRGIIALVFWSMLFLGIGFMPSYGYPWLGILPFLLILLILPGYKTKAIVFQLPAERFDERDVMFSRNTLVPGTREYKAYYKMRPEHKVADDAFREEAGLISKGTKFYNELLFNAAHATFSAVDLLQPLVEHPAVSTKTNINEARVAEFVKNWTLKLGALNVGFTKLKAHHVYTHIGRGEKYGSKVDLAHTNAIAFTVEMSHRSLAYNPKGPVVMESAQQYLNAGQIAVQVAQFIRSLGFEARAHIDANYRVVAPIVAQDAGLGTIGRMGLLMTPELGPRVRIGVVTTNLELPESKKIPDFSVIHFCGKCKKCAENCPSQSISFNNLGDQTNPERWTINHERCFTYWCKAGTDCGRCLAVCPYSHPDNFIHNIIRWMIRRNPVNRWLALKLDDIFYGKKPGSNSLENWMQV